MLRYTKPISLRLINEGASSYVSAARTFLGRMVNVYHEDPVGKRWSQVSPDGVIIEAYIPANGMLPMITITVPLPIKPIPPEGTSIEYMYYLTYSNGSAGEVYRINGETGDVELQGRIYGYTAIPYGFGVYNERPYVAHWNYHRIVDYNGIVVQSADEDHIFALKSVTSDYLVVNTAFNSGDIRLYDHDGNYIRGFQADAGYPSTSTVGANDKTIQVIRDQGPDRSITISDYEGNTLKTVDDGIYYAWYENGSSSRDFQFITVSSGEVLYDHIRIINTLGNTIANFVTRDPLLATWDYFIRMSATSKHIFVTYKYRTATPRPTEIDIFPYTTEVDEFGNVISISIDQSPENTKMVIIEDEFNNPYDLIFLATDAADWNNPDFYKRLI